MWSINLLDTTGAINVNQIDGGQWLISSLACTEVNRRETPLSGMRNRPPHGFITAFPEVAWRMTPRPASWSIGGM
jgi:hypothetical protein